MSDYVTALNRLSEVLGDSAPVWASREEFDGIIYWNEDFSRQVAVSIPINIYQELYAIFGDALTFRFYLGGILVLDLTQNISQETLDQFRNQTRQAATITFDFHLDKITLVNSLYPDLILSCRPFLFIYPETLENFLANCNLTQLEMQFWDQEFDRKTVFLIPKRSIFLNGPFLAIVGGEYLMSLDSVIPIEHDAPLITDIFYERCVNSVKWQTAFVQHLTPLHLDFSIHAGEDDFITRTLLLHRINTILLYIADRSIIRNKIWISVFISSQQSVEIQLTDHPENIIGNLAIGAQVLFELFNWVYDPNWKVTDRIPLVQIGIVHALGAAEPTVRYRLLIENAKGIFDGLQWHWKAFIEGKVEEYIHQILDLEQFVSDTVRQFAEQISSITKGLNETMLAAVGVFIASFIAALFTTTFNPVVFRIGLLVYAGYILIFPMIIYMLQQRDQFKVYKDDFELRRKRFEDRLYKENVDQIIGKQIDRSTTRFNKAVRYTVITYLLVIFLLIAAAIIFPEVIQRSFTELQSTPTPTVVTTSIGTPYQLLSPSTQPARSTTPPTSTFTPRP